MNPALSAIAILLFIHPVIGAGGGMAELKSITGDAPYRGLGNAPAAIPQPKGFWGRVRHPFSNCCGSDKFTSRSGSPYGKGQWLLTGSATSVNSPIPKLSSSSSSSSVPISSIGSGSFYKGKGNDFIN